MGVTLSILCVLVILVCFFLVSLFYINSKVIGWSCLASSVSHVNSVLLRCLTNI